MPLRSGKVRKRPYNDVEAEEESESNKENEDQNSKVAKQPVLKRRKISKSKSKTSIASIASTSKPKAKAKSKPKKASKNQSKEELDSESESESNESKASDKPKPKAKPKPKTNSKSRKQSVAKNSQRNKKLSQRSARSRSQSRSQSQKSAKSSVSQRYSNNDDYSDDADDIDEEQDWKLTQHNDRVLEMYSYISGSVSWQTLKKTMTIWFREEKESENNSDFESNAELTLDLLNLMLYCAGVRVFAFSDINELDLSQWSKKEKKKLIHTLEYAINIDEDEIVVEDDLDDDSAVGRDDEKAHIDSANRKNKQIEVAFDIKKTPILWLTKKKSFESNYKKFWDRMCTACEGFIYDTDDFLITCLIEWCTFFARKFRVTQLRKLGTFTGFCIAKPLVVFMSNNRKKLEQQADQIEVEQAKLDQYNKDQEDEDNDIRTSPRRKRNLERKIKSLQDSVAEYKSRLTNIGEHTTEVFEKILVYKIAENCEIIRCWTLQSLTEWINKDPSEQSFLKSRYWKYLEHGIRDSRSSKVRVCAYRQLMKLFDPFEQFHGKCTADKKAEKKKNSLVLNNTLDTNRETLMRTRLVTLSPFWTRIKTTVQDQGLRDKDNNVVKICIEFLNVMLRNDMLSDDDGDSILNYIFSTDDVIRKSAASFIFLDTFAAEAVSAVITNEERDKRLMKEAQNLDNQEIQIQINQNTKMRDDVLQLIQLMQDRSIDLHLKLKELFEEHSVQYSQSHNQECDDVTSNKLYSFLSNIGMSVSTNHLYRHYQQVADYIVESMADVLPVLTNWKILFGTLLEAESNERRRQEDQQNKSDKNVIEMSDDNDIDDEGQTMLCYLILACIKQVNGFGNDVRNIKRKRGRMKELAEKERLNNLDSLSMDALPYLINLLQIFQADIFKLYPLIQIISLLPIQSFEVVDGKQYLDSILDCLKNIFLQHETGELFSSQEYSLDSEDEMKEQIDAMLNKDEDGMSNEEMEERQMLLMQISFKQMKFLIKNQISNHLYENIAQVFAYLCGTPVHYNRQLNPQNNKHIHEHRYHNECHRFVHELATTLEQQFGTCYQEIEQLLEQGVTLETLNEDDENGNKLDLIQSLYSCLKRMSALKDMINVQAFSFDNRMDKLLEHIQNNRIYDSDYYNLVRVLLRMLQMDIVWHCSTLNFKDPDMQAPRIADAHKQSLKNCLQYFVNRLYPTIEKIHQIENEIEKEKDVESNSNSNSESNEIDLDLLRFKQVSQLIDIIAEIMDSAMLFQHLNGQSEMLNSTFNYYAIFETQVIAGIENNSQILNTCSQSKLCKQLLDICRFVLLLPAISDPFDPSVINRTENIQIRYLLLCIRLCTQNPTYFSEFGALILCFYKRPVVETKVVKSSESNENVVREKKFVLNAPARHDDIIHSFILKFTKSSPNDLQKMYFYAMQSIFNDPLLDAKNKKVLYENLCKSFSMCKGLALLPSHFFDIIVHSLLKYILQNIPKYLHCLMPILYFVKRSVNRDKLHAWSVFLSLERNLPEPHLRHPKSQWELYDQFREKFRELTLTAKTNRNAVIEDIDDIQQVKRLLSPKKQKNQNRVEASELSPGPKQNKRAAEEEQQPEQEQGEVDKEGSEKKDEHSSNGDREIRAGIRKMSVVSTHNEQNKDDEVEMVEDEN